MSRIQKNTSFITIPTVKFDNIWNGLGSGINNNGTSISIDSSNNIYAGGYFTSAGGISVDRVALWNGISWSALGSSGYKGVNYSSQPNQTVIYGMDIDNNNNLYVGGNFDQVGDLVEANYIAKWNGSVWSRLSDSDIGMNNFVYCLKFDNNNNLYAGGNFTTAGGTPANRIAKWDGNAWSALGSGFDNIPYSMIVDSQNNLYVGGNFTTAGGTPVNYIAKWDGSSWSALGSGMNQQVLGLAIDNSDNLYACGNFTIAGGTPASRIAKWDGTSWSALDSQVNESTQCITFKDNNLYVGGGFTQAGTNNYPYFAVWNGNSWSNLNSTINNYVFSISLDSNNNIYTIGSFTVPGLNIAQQAQTTTTSTLIIPKESAIYKRIGII